jgi:GT2 family glycosyltransferase
MAIEFGLLSGHRGLASVKLLLRRLLRGSHIAGRGSPESVPPVPALLTEYFDSLFYNRTYPDVRQSGITPVLHYYLWGAAEGRNPTSYFDTRSYVAEEGNNIPPGMNPFLHFLETIGTIETPKRPLISPAELQALHRTFDLSFYIDYNKLHDCGLDSVFSGLLHYMNVGWRKGLDPCPGFSTETYIKANPDVAFNDINPLLHYVSIGQKERRRPLPLRYCPSGILDFQAELLRAVREIPEAVVSLELRDDVTIVVPVFNASSALADLLQSLASSVAPEQHIILVDDASTDPAVAPILATFSIERPGTRIVHNLTNQGFSAGVNIGIASIPGNNVVVLNSDVVVPPGWLSRLLGPIDRYPETVASVTPFSNTSSLTGFPESAYEGPVYHNCNLQVIDSVFRRMPRCEIDLPSACGFCMVLSAAALQTVGPFDSEVYGRGYFEETDWCQRALAAGFRHLVAVNLFVEHKPGSASFSVEERVLHSDRNRPLFNFRNPGYSERQRLFRFVDPLSGIRDLARVLVWMSAAAGKRLILTHRWGGGIGEYIGRETLRLLDTGHLVFTLEVHGRDSRVVIQYRDERLELTAGPRTALDILLGIEFDEVEIHAIHGAAELPALLRYLTKALTGHRYSVFFHDFLPICPTIHLVDDNGRFCRIPSSGRCLECLHSNDEVRYPVANIHAWRQAWWSLLEKAARLVILDPSAAEYIKKAFPAVPLERFEVSPPDYVPNLPAVRRLKTSSSLNVGVVGRMTLHKGAQVIENLLAHLAKADENVTVTLFGEWHYPALSPTSLRVHGAYRPEQLPKLLADGGVQVALFPSICPETFSFTLSELFAMELPVVAFDIGAQASRVKTYGRGIVCPVGVDPAQLLGALRSAAAL